MTAFNRSFTLQHGGMSISAGLAWTRFQELAEGAVWVQHVEHESKIDPATIPAEGCDVGFVVRDPRSHELILFDSDSVIHANVSRAWTRVTLASRSAAEGTRRTAEIDAFLNDRPEDPETTEFTLWRAGSHGARSSHREITTPAWGDIRGNYAGHVRTALDSLTGMRALRGSGRLILWHGDPGTGKTTAIRSLAREWADRCATHLVTDPEELFGRVDYLYDVVTSAERDDNPWTLLVAEDTDESLREGSRGSSTALGRLLNLTDGILGQGLELIVLLTTNEPVDRLHPALIRPGRCLANVEFTRLDPHESASWLQTDQVAGAKTLAELFEARGDLEVTTAERPTASSGLYL